jgi:hypothetical protein
MAEVREAVADAEEDLKHRLREQVFLYVALS